MDTIYWHMNATQGGANLQPGVNLHPGAKCDTNTALDESAFNSPLGEI